APLLQRKTFYRLFGITINGVEYIGVLGIILLVIFVLTSLLLIGIVMIQDNQGEGLGGIFGGSGGASMGSRSGNILTKTTTILGTVFLVTAFALAWINRTPEEGDVIRAAQDQLSEESNEWWTQSDEDGEESQSEEIPIDTSAE
ncbi:MAG: preprotein translocase subunit SecG, partial [Spirochaetaceae bacterium]